MKKIFAALALITLSFSAVAQNNNDSPWISVSGNDTHKNEFRVGTYELSRTKNGEEVAVVVNRRTVFSTNRITMNKQYVRTRDCHRGFGKLVTLDLNGDFLYDNDYVNDGGTIASANAEFICLVYAADLKKRSSNGI